jgi:hypothetical protein
MEENTVCSVHSDLLYPFSMTNINCQKSEIISPY